MNEQPMTPGDRRRLESLARKRAKVATSMIGERVKVLRAEVEDQLSAEHKFDDELWADVNRQAQREVAKADAHIAEVCRKLGIPENLRPSISVGWHQRGENMLASRRAELRKLAQARIDAAAQSAKVAIEANLLGVETELIRGGLESTEAIAYVDSMPTVEQLLPTIQVAELGPGKPPKTYGRGDLDEDTYVGRYGGWQPPQDAAGSLLTPSTATTRDAKRQAIAAALAANPDGSDREVARLTGVDHKTVGKLRGQGGEIPSPTEELPTTEDGDDAS